MHWIIARGRDCRKHRVRALEVDYMVTLCGMVVNSSYFFEVTDDELPCSDCEAKERMIKRRWCA